MSSRVLLAAAVSLLLVRCASFGAAPSDGNASPPDADALAPADGPIRPDSPLPPPPDRDASDGAADASVLDACVTTKRMFVTNGEVPASVVNDGPCQNEATAAGLVGSKFHVWASTSSVDAISLLPNTSGYMTMNGKLLFCSKAELTRTYLRVPLTRPDGSGIDSTSSIWTGTGTDLKHLPDASCHDWTSVDPTVSGEVGKTAATNVTFASSGPLGCEGNAFLICYEE
jgi:hypothetical protein